MLKLAEKTDLCQISLTGARAIVLLGLLIEAPRSLEEIRDAFVQMKLMSGDNSDDIIRIDMNTLKIMGCEISRSCARTNYKYELLNHPFLLDISKEEINVIKKAYKIAKEDADIDLLFHYDSLFTKLASFVKENEVKEDILGLSPLKYYDIDLLKQLAKDCRLNNSIQINYKSPVSKSASAKNIIAQKIVLKNDKLYLLCHNLDKDEASMFNIKRINSVISRENGSSSIPENKSVKVKFLLKRFTVAGILENEKIIESNTNGSSVIEGDYHNEFIAIQRILSFGPACTVIEPENIKQKVIEKLLSMREVYKND